jgi:thiaminase/transcriptional activator TenA
LYQRWIEMYAGPEYAEFVDWCISLMNEAGQGLPERELVRLEGIFRTSTRYEARFWEMAWAKEAW